MRGPMRRVWSHGTASSGSTDWLVVCCGCLRLWYERRLGCWRSGAAADWCETRLEELQDVQSSPNIRVSKSRRKRRAEHVARIEEKGNIYTCRRGNMKERVRLKDLSTGERIILKLILQTYFRSVWTGWVGLKMEGTVVLLWTWSRTFELCTYNPRRFLNSGRSVSLSWINASSCYCYCYYCVITLYRVFIVI
jgi:hypothetical protein